MENEQRRQFLKIAAFGGLAFLVGKFFSNTIDFLTHGHVKTTYFDNFKVTESKDELGVYDSDGRQILVIDKEGL